MKTMVLRLYQEPRIKTQRSVSISIRLHHPSTYSIRVKLFVPRLVKRVGEIHPFTVPTQLHHLRTAIHWFSRTLRMRRPLHDSTNWQNCSQLRLIWYRYIITMKLTGPPAGDVE